MGENKPLRADIAKRMIEKRMVRLLQYYRLSELQYAIGILEHADEYLPMARESLTRAKSQRKRDEWEQWIAAIERHTKKPKGK